MPKRKVHSVKTELLTKSREAMLCAVQIFNNPSISFKSESFIVLSIVAWTYMLHAYYRTQNIDYRYFEQRGLRKKFDKTKRGSYKFWELERCLNDKDCPVDAIPKANLKFLIGLRHEIEHQMTSRIDDYLSARFQACCLNYNRCIKQLFGAGFAIDKHLSLSLQFSAISEDQISQLRDFADLPKNIASFINSFDSEISDADFKNPQYSYSLFFTPKTVNHKGQADNVIEFIPAGSPEAEGLNKSYAIVKDREKPKFLPSAVVKLMQDDGFTSFRMGAHTDFWREKDAKNPAKGFGVQVATTWYWYESWVNEVRMHCQENSFLYS
jgi:hypothetical protein